MAKKSFLTSGKLMEAVLFGGTGDGNSSRWFRSGVWLRMFVGGIAAVIKRV